MRFIDDWFPLLVVLQNSRFDESEMQELKTGYERYFRRNDRYAVLTVSPDNFVPPAAKERKLVADWLSEPDVRKLVERLCVGSGTVVPNAIVRGALTALTWLWRPQSDFHLVSTVEEGMDHCIGRLIHEKVPMQRPTESLCGEVVERLRSLGGFEPSLRSSLTTPIAIATSEKRESEGTLKGARGGRPPTT